MTKRLVYILPEASDKTHMKYNVEFLKGLSESGVEVFLILERGYEGGGSAAALTLKDYLNSIQQKTGAKYVRYTGTIFFTRIPKLKLFLLEAMFRGIKKVYVHYSFVGALYASLNPFFTVYYWNCGIPWKYKRPFLQELYESVAYKLIDHFVTGAQVLTEQYSRFYKFNNKKSIVIPNWIDVENFRKIFNNAKKTENQIKLKQELNIQNQKVLFFNQRLAERKGAHYIPTILSNLPLTSKDFVMLITNDGPYKEKLIAELREKNLFENVRMLGRVPNEKVIELLAITDIYVLPSEEEGMSHSLMEAMCAAVPAVSFDVGGTVDMYPENFRDYVIEEKNIVEFNKKISELLQDENKAKLLGEALSEKVKEYDKTIVLEKFKSIVML